MFARQLVLSVRNLRRNLVYSTIVITGLALGISVFFTIIQWAGWHYSFDRSFDDSKQIYRLSIKEKGDNFERHTARILHDDIIQQIYTQDEISGIETIGRLSPFRNAIVRKNDIVFYENRSFLCDAEFWDIFQTNLIHGDPDNFLKGPNKIVLTERLAIKYFGNKDPIGQTLEIMHQFGFEAELYEVSGIIEDFPENCHFKVDLLTSISDPETFNSTSWVYLKLKESASYKEVEAEIMNYIIKNNDEDYENTLSSVLTPLRDIHLKSNLAREIEHNIGYKNVLIILIAGMLVFLLAWFNFSLLNISQNQINIKKLICQWQLGAGKKVFFRLFFSDYILIGSIAIVLSVILQLIFHIPIEKTIGISISGNMPLFLSCILLFILVFILSASLTSLFATYRLYKILKLKYFSNNSKSSHPNSKNLFISSVIIAEFVITYILICNLFLIREQINFAIANQIGATETNTIQIPNLPRPIVDNYDLLKEELEKYPVFSEITAMMEEPGGLAMDAFSFEIEGLPDNQDHLFVFPVDEDFIRFYDLEIIAGKDFPLEYNTKDTTEFYILNETAARMLGFDNYNELIGRELNIKFVAPGYIYPGDIIGIVKDFHLSSFDQEVNPMVIFPEYTWLFCFSLRIAGEEQEALSILRSTWKELFPNYPLRYQFTSELYDELYETDKTQILILVIFSIISLFIAGTGLFALSSFFIQQKMHASAIKKIHGASKRHIIVPELMQYLSLAILSTLIAFPLTWVFIKNWLNNFSYQIDIPWMLFIAMIAFLIIFSWISVFYHAFKLAKLTPTSLLRNE